MPNVETKILFSQSHRLTIMSKVMDLHVTLTREVVKKCNGYPSFDQKFLSDAEKVLTSLLEFDFTSLKRPRKSLEKLVHKSGP